ncbi:hypothetical protein [Flavobacterium sp.]|uniref:hypothetical protein n=1 Tax=Flavobacterium sp. TaxID=239 RepID=UPI002FDB373A
MQDFLIKLKLIDYLNTTLSISKTEFAKRLSQITERGNPNMLLNPFEAFSTDSRLFKGLVSETGFKLRRKRQFFTYNSTVAQATGTLSEVDGKLIITTEINGYNSYFKIFYFFLVIFYVGFISICMVTDSSFPFPVLPFIVLHAGFMFCIPYFIMRRGVRQLKHDLDREFFFLTRNS